MQPVLLGSITLHRCWIDFQCLTIFSFTFASISSAFTKIPVAPTKGLRAPLRCELKAAALLGLLSLALPGLELLKNKHFSAHLRRVVPTKDQTKKYAMRRLNTAVHAAEKFKGV